MDCQNYGILPHSTNLSIIVYLHECSCAH